MKAETYGWEFSVKVIMEYLNVIRTLVVVIQLFQITLGLPYKIRIGAIFTGKKV